jgi:hypothetical protein
VGFVLPVYQIHKIMLKEKVERLEILEKIIRAQIPVIGEPEKMELPEINKNNEYDVLLDQYKDVENFTTWPFDTSIWRKFITSEIVLIFTWVTARLGWLGENDKKLVTDTLKTLLGIS